MLTVVIPSYKNKEQLIRNIEHNMRFLKNYPIIIVNDYPADNLSQEFEKYSNVTVLTNTKNLGFGLTVNRGVSEATTPYVFLMNSDVILNDQSFTLAVKALEKDRSLFAVSFAQREKDGKVVGKNSYTWHHGLFFHRGETDNKLGNNGWAEGGSCIVDREIFQKLGGFDPLYAPFYWEDLDLSYRAWKQGYKVIFDPDILVEHHHESTIKKYYQTGYITTISYRNQFIFIWKNITDFHLALQHIFLLVPNMLYYTFIKRDIYFVRGFFQAVRRMGTILSRRKRNQQVSTVSDTKVISKVHAQ